MRHGLEADEDNDTAFEPRDLADAEMSAPRVKRAQIGACFARQLDSLPSENAQILWEVSKSFVNPPQFKPVKPKCG